MFAYTKLMQAMAAAGVVSATDPYFNLTTLLLNTSSTNGAQNNTFLDSSTNNFTITRNGNTTQGTFTPFSQTGWSNYFDGSSRLTFASDTSNVFGTGAFTVECWYYYTTSTTSGTAFITKGSGGTNWQFYVSGANGYLSWSNGSSAVNSSTTPVANSWNHFVYVRDGSNNSAMFLNGTRIYSGTDSTNYSGTGSVYIASDGSAYYFTGYLSNIRLVKGSAVYSPTSTTCTVPTSSLTAISGTAILTCQSNRFIDSSSIALVATVSGTPSVQAFSPFAPTAAYDTAVVGGSGYFDGSGDYLSLASNTALTPASSTYTFECWVYRTASGAMTIWDTSVTNGFYVHINGSNKVVLRAYGTADIITSSANAPVNAWFHVAVARGAANSTKMWINGSSTDGGSATDSTTYAAATTYIGIYDGSTVGLTGYISNLRLVKGSDVYGVSNSTITVPTAPFTAITNTSLLLNYTNAGIFDSTAKNVLETVGNAQVSTTQAKWGTTSMYFDGTGDWLISPYSVLNEFGSGNLTIEMWINTSASGQYITLLSKSPSSFASGMWSIQINGATAGSGAVVVYAADNSTTTPLLSTTGASVIDNVWHHIAVVRNGSSWTLYIDGTSRATATWSGTIAVLSGQIWVGADQNFGRAYTGYIDDLRITKGYARYTSNFTAPTAAFGTQ